jgi:phosphatidate cytidylyltransferase
MAAPDLPASPAPAGERIPSELLVRVASAAVLIAICLVAVANGTVPTALLIGSFLVLALIEYQLITSRLGASAPVWVLVPLALLFFTRFFMGSSEGFILGLGITAAITAGLAAFLFTRSIVPGLQRWALAVAGALYLGWMLGFFMALYTARNDWRLGLGWLVALVGSTIMGDTGALLVGTRFGSRRFFPAISPHKTVEGSIAGFVGQTLTFAFFALFVDVPAPHIFILGALVAVAAQTGDLIESQFKRAAGIKDASALIPGHGGVLDRMDSLILVPAVAYYYMTLVLNVRLPQ